MGICVGDTAIFMAYDCLSQASTDRYLSALFSKELHLVGIGEMIDVHMAASSSDPSTEEITDMYRYKTARYTFSLPFMIGAKLAQADEEIITALETFGENAGILFQIRDDSLGLVGDEKDTGKPVGADIKENKKTVHKAMLFTIASDDEKKELNTMFGNKDLTEDQRNKVLSVLEKYDIENKVALVEKSYHAQALEALSQLPNNLKNNLTEILELIHSRKK
jgi:geranylgeranyl diphosphate synthase type I